MKYPKFLNNNSTIGVTALSSGVGEKLESFNLSITNLKNNFNIIETKNVRSKKEPSTTAQKRVKELNELVENKDIDMVLCASGGDFLIETIPLIDFDKIKENPKWFMGYSDPTSLLYIITTKLDIATMYGVNAGSFDQRKLHKSLQNSIEFMKGNLVLQEKEKLYEKDKDDSIDGYNLTEINEWDFINQEEINIEGRLIGGCIDVLRDIFGTKYDYSNQFIEKYKDDGIIWYFDNFALASEDLYRTLFMMNERGYFKNTKCVLFGKTLFSTTFTNLDYKQALKKIFKDIPVVYNMDIGHVRPTMTMINGSIIKIEMNNKDKKITFRLD